MITFVQGEKVLISPVGDVIGEDGRTFTISADIIKEVKTHIPLDENHGYGRAVGWFDKDTLEVRADGIYASLELNDEGKALIDSKAYRYMSPVFEMSDNRIVTGIDSVGLVNTPNLLFKELNKVNKSISLQGVASEVRTESESERRTAMPQGAHQNKKEKTGMTEAEFQAALAAKDKKIQELEAAQKESEAKHKELETKVSASDAAAKDAEIDKLLAEGAITEEQKEFVKELNSKQLAIFVEQNKKLLAFAGERLKLDKNAKGGSVLIDKEQAMCKKMGISEADYIKNKEGDK